MKKVWIAVVVAAMLLSLSACGASSTKSASSAAGTSTSASESKAASSASKTESKAASSASKTESKAASSASKTESKAASSASKTESKAASSASKTESKAASAAEQTLTGTLADCTMHTFTLKTEDGKSYSFTTDDNTKVTMANGMLDDAKVTVTYTGEIKDGDASGCTVVSVADAK